MHNFIPIPHKSSDEWASDEVINILDAGSSQEILINSDSWLSHGYFESEPCALPYPILFYNATDCLLWLRWWVLPVAFLVEKGIDDYGIRGKEVVIENHYAEIAAQIDSCPDGTDAAEFLKKHGEKITNQLSKNDRFQIYPPKSIHDWMSNYDDLEHWQHALEDSNISCVDGIWNLSESAWIRLEELHFLY